MKENYGYNLLGFKLYAFNRFLRLFPLHWVLLIIAFIIVLLVGDDFASAYNGSFGIPRDVTSTLANITLIYPSFHPIEVAPRLSPASWALTVEIFYYILIGIGISKTKKFTIIWAISSLLYWIFQIFNQPGFIAGYGSFAEAYLPFSIGALTYYFKQEIWTLTQRFLRKPTIVLSTLFLINLFVSILYNSIAMQILTTYLNIILTIGLIIALLFEKKNIVSKQIDRHLGDLSYPLYLFHWSAACLCSWFIWDAPVKGLSYEGIIVFSVALLLTVVISFVLNITVNNQINKIRQAVKRQISQQVVGK
jgi:peptidoglycan/LPS O-acetylase OafA/YrhL